MQETRETFASRTYHGESDFVPPFAVELLSVHCLNQTAHTEISFPWKCVTHDPSLDLRGSSLLLLPPLPHEVHKSAWGDLQQIKAAN